MSYNKYTPRIAQRYNTPGTFVSAGNFAGGSGGDYGIMGPPRQPQPVQTFNKPISQNSDSNFQMPMPPPPQVPEQLLQKSAVLESMETSSSEVKPDVGEGDAPAKPFWMKSKLVGVKKISNRERRRRQNENLRRLLTPKNALMVLNEIMSGEQLANQFKVCAVSGDGAQYYKPAMNSFCAELNVDGHMYMGYGETKMLARNNAAEQAIRDLMIKRMGKLFADAVSGDDGNGNGATQGGPVPMAEGAGSVPGDAEGEGEQEAADTLPMIQLASYALHKLFTEWECEGHKVPQLKPHTVSETTSETSEASGAPNQNPAPAKSKPRAPRQVPEHASTMHPCMLLTYMRPQLEYRELASYGETPQTMVFTMAVDVDGITYVGKAGNKKEARKAAAKAACEDIFHVKFEF